MNLIQDQSGQRSRLSVLAATLALTIAALGAGAPVQPARAAIKPWLITCDGRSKCTASGFDFRMKNMRVSWWQSVKGGSTTSWGSSVDSKLTAIMTGTAAKKGQCTIWWVSYSGHNSPNYAVRDWKVIGSRCP